MVIMPLAVADSRSRKILFAQHWQCSMVQLAAGLQKKHPMLVAHPMCNALARQLPAACKLHHMVACCYAVARNSASNVVFTALGGLSTACCILTSCL